MSNRAARGIVLAEVDEASVASYLEACPEFFDRHAQMLARMRLPDSRNGGTTVSLLERQVEVLRERSRQLENKLADFIQVARDNDQLGLKILRLGRRLIETRDLAGTVAAIEASMREDFGAQRAVLLLLRTDDALAGEQQSFLRVAAPDDPEIRTFEQLLESGKPRCGQLRDSHRNYLFGQDAVDIGSAALVPLGDKIRLGLLACGSSDREHFSPAVGTDYLSRISELISSALIKCNAG